MLSVCPPPAALIPTGNKTNITEVLRYQDTKSHKNQQPVNLDIPSNSPAWYQKFSRHKFGSFQLPAHDAFPGMAKEDGSWPHLVY